ncbi:hypothetical protein SAMN05444166_4051 [Singulisphaera sp. GP187]|uniref:hypothetical protein n=1 Tax=Singulisphaera sp. GP187 TaxID=1882752 RepID=UPI00092916F1|nr:hypothetical protein [Singulisphaera sp. GP187]SIO35626.1 hypothetical protein SAMN05444166_4051 [Singulisphaera sp. GP187]
MGQLSIISVTGAVPHSACKLEFNDIKYKDDWLGFGPSTHRSPATRVGKVFHDDESYRMNHGIRIHVTDTVLAKAGEKVARQYSTGSYVVCVRDCVSFSADLIRACRLNVPLVNMTPYGLILILAVWNKYEELW